jgi:hypothetical protein
MTTESLPRAADADHLTEALRRSGALRDGSVRGVIADGSRATLLSRVDRLRLTYEGEALDAPNTIILKSGLPERLSRNAGSQEVAFYAQVTAQMPAGLVPRCFEACWDAETTAWHLLLEDLTDSHLFASRHPLPPTMVDSKRIIAAWARFHALWWDDPRLGVSIGTWLGPDDPQIRSFAAEFARFADQLGDRLSSERRNLYEQLIDAGPRLNKRYHSHRNLTIVHGDSHVWNVFLPRVIGSDDVRIFDWARWRVNVSTHDLAYMMALYWYPDHRRRVERPLLDHYHAEIVAHGVTGYDRRALDDDYRLSVLWQIAKPVWQAASNIPARTWWNNLQCIFLAIDDLGCRELLA